MTNLIVQDRKTLQTYELGLDVRKGKPMVEIVEYVARVYPHLHIVARA